MEMVSLEETKSGDVLRTLKGCHKSKRLFFHGKKAEQEKTLYDRVMSKRDRSQLKKCPMAKQPNL